jgi:hypothetical protein
VRRKGEVFRFMGILVQKQRLFSYYVFLLARKLNGLLHFTSLTTMLGFVVVLHLVRKLCPFLHYSYFHNYLYSIATMYSILTQQDAWSNGYDIPAIEPRFGAGPAYLPLWGCSVKPVDGTSMWWGDASSNLAAFDHSVFALP